MTEPTTPEPGGQAPQQLLIGQWCADLRTRGGTRLLVRPANPEDEALLADFFTHVTPDDMRFRFLSPVSHPGHDLLARLVGVDHVRDENFLAFAQDGRTLIATAMVSADAAMEKAEVAIAIHADFRDKGAGWTLLDYAAQYAEAKGIKTLESVEAHDNREAIALEREMGFSARFCPDDPRLVIVSKRLGRERP